MLHYALPTINLVLFEKPALDSKKLASGKGNNLILSNLVEGGNIVIPPVLCDMCLHLAVCVCICALM